MSKFATVLKVAGIIAGVGGVLGFVPLIMIMFFLIAALEDSGYVARMAYMLDRVFRDAWTSGELPITRSTRKGWRLLSKPRVTI